MVAVALAAFVHEAKEKPMPEVSLTDFVVKTLKASKNIPGFVYWGDLDLGETWAFVPFTRWRECPLLVLSNFEVVRAHLFVRYPDEVEVIHASHWATGWVDHLAVKMLDENSEITGAAEAVYEMVQRLDDYPVLDDFDLGRRENEAAVDGLQHYIMGVLRQDVPEDWRERLLDRLHYYEVHDDLSLRFSHDVTLLALEMGFLVEDAE